jgi:DNA polymerase III delta prime subunit
MTKSLIDFETTQPFATRFFTEALASGHLVNSYIMRGQDMSTIYRMILRLAQIINCKDKPDAASACGICQNCRWIEDNAHPGIITVSNLSYLLDVDPETGAARSKTGKPQKSIVVGQLVNLLQELSMHSGGFHRVVILAGAQEIALAEGASPAFPQPHGWYSQQDGQIQWVPLDRKLFPDVLANKFLKTLEEPPKDVLFFILTDSQDKLLDTIVSRCQMVPFATPMSFYEMPLSHRGRETFVAMLQGSATGDFMKQTLCFAQYLEETGIASDEGLMEFQAFLREQMVQSPADVARFEALKQAILQLDHARRQIRDKVREEAVLEDLFLNFALR